MTNKRRKIGILGYGDVGKFLADAIRNNENVSAATELAFVWNRSEDRLKADAANLSNRYWLSGSDAGGAVAAWCAAGGEVDLIVETSHPGVIREHGVKLLSIADLMVGSPGAFANAATEGAMRRAAATSHGCYIPSGASWGVSDIAKMDRLDRLTSLTVTMSFHPDSIRDPAEPIRSTMAAYLASRDDDNFVLYEGPVRDICAMAPNNVNTMACLSMAASSLGFDRVRGVLVTGRKLSAHIVEIEVRGPDGFHVMTRRYNPSAHGAVTGNATFATFLGSLLLAGGQGPGIHFC